MTTAMLIHQIIASLMAMLAARAFSGSVATHVSPPPPDARCEPECSHQPGTQVHQDTTPTQGPVSTVDDLLSALASADANLTSFSAVVKYVKEDLLLDDVQERRGTLRYRVDQDSGLRQFSVMFTRLRLGNVWHDDRKDYVFDGRFLVERLHVEHQFFKREVVRPGEQYDPLSIDGPFPLPIGQKKSDLLRRFDAKLLEPENEGRLAGHYHLMLTARDRTDGDRLDTVELWYDPASLLPTKAVVTEKTGDLSTVELAEPARNPADLDPGLFSTMTPDPLEGWKIEITHLDFGQEGMGRKPVGGSDH